MVRNQQIGMLPWPWLPPTWPEHRSLPRIVWSSRH